MLLPPFQLATSTTIIHELKTPTDAKFLMYTLFTNTHMATPPFEFLIIRVIMIIYAGTFYLVYFIYMSNINDITVIIIICKGNVYINFLLFIYISKINDVTAIIFTTVIHFGTIDIFTTVWQILNNARF